MNALRLILLGCLLLPLGLMQIGCSSKKDGATGGSGKAAELILGKWQHEGKDGAAKVEITLDFTADKVAGKWSKDGSGPSMNGTYKVLDENTVEIPKFGGAFEDKVKIESITKDKLALSGFSYKSGKYEFTREGGAAAGSPTKKADRIYWQYASGRFMKLSPTKWLEKTNDNKTWAYAEKERTPEYVDLFDMSRDCTVRLENAQALTKTGNADFQKLQDGKWAPSPQAAYTDLILGVWEPGKTKDFPCEIRVEFTADGKMKWVEKTSPPTTWEIPYEIYNDRMVTSQMEDGKQAKAFPLSILTLNDKQLIYLDIRGNVMTCKKK